MRVLAPWRQRAAVAPGGAAAEEGQPLEVARKSAAAGAVDPGEAAQPLEVARKSGRSGDLIEEAGLCHQFGMIFLQAYLFSLKNDEEVLDRLGIGIYKEL